MRTACTALVSVAIVAALRPETMNGFCDMPISLTKHVKARQDHPGYTTGRAPVADNQVLWSEPYDAYTPTDYTHDVVAAGPSWADPADMSSVDWSAGHKSYWSHRQCGLEPLSEALLGYPAAQCFANELLQEKNATGSWGIPIAGTYPKNYMGRTGMTGRGLLGKWGANQAADPVVTRCKDGKLQVALIERKDTSTWAIPGGMVDPGEIASAAAKREFIEEAGGDETKLALLNEAFRGGTLIYTGYVDDPRNTDNAWMETAAFHFHNDAVFGQYNLVAGDDAGKAQWVTIEGMAEQGASCKIALEEPFARSSIYTSTHEDFIRVAYHNAQDANLCR